MDRKKLHLIAKYDCEPLRERSPQCGGPATWDESERAILGIAKLYTDRGLEHGCTFALTPEAAAAHPDLFRSLRDYGFNIEMQPNIPAFRYPTYERDLGLYSAAEQRDIIRLALSDFEDALGFSTTGYAPCCGSRSDATAPILAELGFQVLWMPATGRYPPDRPDKMTIGMFPFPHRASALHRCLAGDLDLMVIPSSGDITGKHSRSPGVPADLRGEWPVSKESHAMYRGIVDNWIQLGLDLGVPAITIRPTGHNTANCKLENVAYVLDYITHAAEGRNLQVVPATPADIHQTLGFDS